MKTPRVVKRQAVLIPAIQAPELPAAALAYVFDEAVAGALTNRCLNEVSAVLTAQPNGFEVTLAAVCRFYESTFDQALSPRLAPA
jgi:hypothetical protein